MAYVKKGTPRGGKRPGAGGKKILRAPKMEPEVVAFEGGDDAAAVYARAYTKQMIDVLVTVACGGASEAARVSAAAKVIERGWGAAVGVKPDDSADDGLHEEAHAEPKEKAVGGWDSLLQ